MRATWPAHLSWDCIIVENWMRATWSAHLGWDCIRIENWHASYKTCPSYLRLHQDKKKINK